MAVAIVPPVEENASNNKDLRMTPAVCPAMTGGAMPF
jgi:hypothetical protein